MNAGRVISARCFQTACVCALVVLTISVFAAGFLLSRHRAVAVEPNEHGNDFAAFRARAQSLVEKGQLETLEHEYCVKLVRVELRVEVIAGEDGGLLRTGGKGWINVVVSNPRDEGVDIRTGTQLGKAGPWVSPSYATDRHSYFGFEVAGFDCEFLDEKGAVVHTVRLDPPDGPLVLAKGELQETWRTITAPDKPGTYQVRVHLNTALVQAMMCTYNIAQGSSDACIAETTVGRVVVRDQSETGQ
jgi:hypothetical protein